MFTTGIPRVQPLRTRRKPSSSINHLREKHVARKHHWTLAGKEVVARHRAFLQLDGYALDQDRLRPDVGNPDRKDRRLRAVHVVDRLNLHPSFRTSRAQDIPEEGERTRNRAPPSRDIAGRDTRGCQLLKPGRDDY